MAKKLTLYVYDDGESTYLTDFKQDSLRKATDADLTIDALAEYMDNDAENGNYHGIVGAHAKLARLLGDRMTPENLRLAFLELAAHGGLHNLADSLL